MTVPLKLITFAVTKPKTILGAAMALFVVCSAILLFSSPAAISYRLAQGFPHMYTDPGKKNDLAYQDDMIIALRNPDNPKGMFSEDALVKAYTFCSELSSFTLAEKERPPLIAQDFLGLCNVDMVSEETLGSAPLTPLIPENFSYDTADIDRLIQRMGNHLFFDNLIISRGKQSTALYLPLQSSGVTADLVSAGGDLAKQLSLSRDQLYYGGLSLYRETFFQQGYWKGLLLSTLSCLLVCAVISIVFKKISHGLVVLFPVVNTVLVVLIAQVATGLSADIFIFTSPGTIAVLTLLNSLFFFHTINNNPKWTRQDPEPIKKLIEPYLGTWFKLMYTMLFACLAILVAAPAPLFSMGPALALGVIVSWFQVLLLIPAGLVFFGPTKRKSKPAASYLLPPETPDKTFEFPYLGAFISKKPMAALILTCALTFICAAGIALLKQSNTLISLYKQDHSLYRSEQLLNKNFAGIYRLFLRIQAPDRDTLLEQTAGELKENLFRPLAAGPDTRTAIMRQIDEALSASTSKAELHDSLAYKWQQELSRIPEEDALSQDLWSIALDSLSGITYDSAPLAHPDILNYLDQLSLFLRNKAVVSKVFSLVDLTKMMHQELYEGAKQHYTIPTTTNGILQTWQQYRKGRHPESFSRFINHSFNTLDILLLLRNSSPDILRQIRNITLEYMENEPPPVPIEISWEGDLQAHTAWSEQLNFSLLGRWGAFLLIASVLFTLFTRSIISGSALLMTGAANLVIVLGSMGIGGLALRPCSAAFAGLALFASGISTWQVLYTLRQRMDEGDFYRDALSGALEENSLPLLTGWGCVTAGALPFFFTQYTLFSTTSSIAIAATGATCLTSLFLLPSLGSIFYEEAEIELLPGAPQRTASPAGEQEEAKTGASTGIDIAFQVKTTEPISPIENTASLDKEEQKGE